MKYEVDRSGRVIRAVGTKEYGRYIVEGPSPIPNCESGGYSLVDGEFVLTDENAVVQHLQKLALQHINARRQTLFWSDVPYGDSAIQFRDAEDQMNLTNLQIAALSGVDVEVILADNSKAQITAAEYSALYSETLVKKSAIRLHARTLKDAVLACTTIADIEAIDLDSGWPE